MPNIVPDQLLSLIGNPGKVCFVADDVEMLGDLEGLFRPAEMRRGDMRRVEVEEVRDQQEKKSDLKEGREEGL